MNAAKQPWLILPLALTSIFCCITLYGWPVAVTLNADLPQWMREAAGMLSIALSLLFMHLVANAFGSQKPCFSRAL